MFPIRLFLIAILLLGNAALAVSQEKRAPLAFTNVTIIDCTGAPAKTNMTLVVSDDKITVLGKSDGVAVPNDAQLVDCSGKFMIPGLWDMHVHANTRKYAFPLLTASGVTGVRVMVGGTTSVRNRDQVRNGTLQIQRMHVANTGIKQSPQKGKVRGFVVATPDEARQAVKASQEAGYDFIKVGSVLERELYDAVADESKRLGIPFAGHLPYSVSAEHAAAQGQRSIEHVWCVGIECSRDAVELRAKMSAATGWRDEFLIQRQAWRTYDPEKAAELFAKFVVEKTWQCPTLALQQPRAYPDNPSFDNDPRLRRVPTSESDRWKRDRKSWLSYKDEEQERLREYYKLVREMHNAGVKILAGTDSGNPYCFHELGIQDELELLVRAGLTPEDALLTATRYPAEFLDRLDELGTVEVGKLADLVLLDDDPLANIGNTRQIFGVVMHGNWLPKPTLQRMLVDAERTARIEALGGRWERDFSQAEAPVFYVSFEGKSIDDEAIAMLVKFDQLKNISLRGTGITDAPLRAFAAIRDNKTIHTLSLSQTSVTSEGLSYLKGMAILKNLLLIDTSVGDAGLAHLGSHPELSMLRLDGTSISDEGMIHMQTIEKLTDLGLSRTKVTDEGLRQLATLPNLERLKLNRTQVTDAGLRHLKTLTTLRQLDLAGTEVTDAGVAEIKTAIPQLEVSR